MSRPARGAALGEIAAMSALLLSYIWLWQDAFTGDTVLVVALYFGLGFLSHLRRNETPSEIGLRLDNSLPALRNALLAVGPLLLAGLVAGAILESWHFPSAQRAIVGLAWRFVWGTVQQYGLVCFFYRRFAEVLRSERWALFAAGALFALFHLPNLFLTAVTLIAGTVSCWLYRREPNLLVLGLFHAAMSFVLYYALPDSITHRMRVGPGFLGSR